MRRWSLLATSLVFIAALADSARGQASGKETSSQIRKEFALGRHLAEDLERRDGSINDPAILGYVQGIENRLAAATGAKATEVRITRGVDLYAHLLRHDVLYMSGALLERIENEAELAGLLAHQLAHGPGRPAPSQGQVTMVIPGPEYILASQIVPFRSVEDRRESEQRATKAAVQILSVVGYEPSAVLDLLSKLAYEHPFWAKAIVPADLLSLRDIVQTNVPPEAGYLVDSSGFVQQHARLSAALGHAASKTSVPGLTLPPRH